MGCAKPSLAGCCEEGRGIYSKCVGSRMENLVYALLWLALTLSVTSVSTLASEQAKSPSQTSQTGDPLTRAAEQFKVLTRERGMRPESPIATLEHQGRKLLWHGRLYENFRNDVLDAIPHQVKQNGETNSPLRRNQFGFNVAGPLLIPHVITNPRNTFFMLAYEGVRERISRAALHTIPTALQRSGDFSQIVDQYPRSPFPGNRIPPSRLAPEVQQALALYPLPNTDIGPFFERNYFVNSQETDLADGGIAKVEHQFSDRHRLTSLTSISTGFLGSAKYFPNVASPTAPDQQFSTWRTELDYVFTANSKTANSASFTVASEAARSGEGSASPFPRYELVGGYLSMGTAFPQLHNARNTFDLRDEVSTRTGPHSLRLTFQADRYQVNSFSPSYPSGYFQFAADITSLPGIINTGDPFASFLLGLPQYAERTIITSPSYFRASYQSVAGGDKYQLTKDLTLNAGLNLSRRTPRLEKYNRQSTIDPSAVNPSNQRPGALVFADRNGIPRGLRRANLDLDPSLGIVWNPRGDAKTVVRASFSRSHAQIPIYDGQWGTQGFNARQTLVSPNRVLSPAFELAQGLPPFTTPLPDLSPSAADNTIADFVDLSGREPVYQSASLSVEREIPFSMIVSVGTNYSAGRDILVGDAAANPNAIDPRFLSYGDELYSQAFRDTLQPYPQYKGFELYGLYPAGQYERNSAFLRVEKRTSFGLAFTAYYEFSKQLDDYSGPYGNQDLLNLHNNWALSSYSTPQYLQLTYSYELPFGSDKPLLHFSGWGGRVVQHWSINGTAYWNDGTPLALRPQFNHTGGVLSTLNVNVVPGVDRHVAHPGPSLWFNPAAFDQPPDFTLGNGPTTLPDLLGPGYNSLDLSLNKRVPVGGGRALEFSAAAFDVLNHGNWNYPDPIIGPADAPNVDAGKIVGSYGGRVIQLGLKLSF